MIGSNFPVDKGSYGYRVFWNAMKKLVMSRPPEQAEALLSGNAVSHYRLAA
jgi:predicted TIM-barrel fold metal-dependent hydrolase